MDVRVYVGTDYWKCYKQIFKDFDREKVLEFCEGYNPKILPTKSVLFVDVESWETDYKKVGKYNPHIRHHETIAQYMEQRKIKCDEHVMQIKTIIFYAKDESSIIPCVRHYPFTLIICNNDITDNSL